MKARVLIVDDHEIVRDGIISLLNEENKYEIAGQVCNGLEALELLGKEKVDLVIMDINMPEMNGIQCTRKINKLYPNVKVLVLTMHNEELYLETMLEAGAHGYILKSFGKEELLQAIERVIAGHFYFSGEITLSILKRLTKTEKKKQQKLEIILTKRESEILKLIVKEHTNSEIADLLNISTRTVDAHRRNLLEKIGARNTAGLVKFAVERKLFNL